VNPGSNRAVFLDRDGTMIEDVGYLSRVEQLALYPWTTDAIRALNRAGFSVVVTTNQSGIARGLFAESDLDIVHRELDRRLSAGGAVIRAYYYCPHHPAGTVPAYTRACDCRKPGAGMIDRAVRELGIDPAASAVVGDTWRDVGLARNAGAKAVLVRTGSGAASERRPPEDLSADAMCDNLAAAASWILQNL
jgi:D-glycero-D-manno-heptose 1,7-bisphosphate phosphatase